MRITIGGRIKYRSDASGAIATLLRKPGFNLNPDKSKSLVGCLQLEAVVRRVLWIIEDVTAKVLIFSTWQDVLELTAHALAANSIPFAYPRGGKNFSADLKRFRSAQPAAELTTGCATDWGGASCSNSGANPHLDALPYGNPVLVAKF